MLRQYYKVFFNDMELEESQFLNDIVASLNADKDDELKLINLVAVIDCGQVLINNKLRTLISKTNYVKKYGFEKALDFFREKMAVHLRQIVDNEITHISAIPIMLTSISSVPIYANNPVINIPGCSYHRDGGGKPISTKITQTEEKKWQGGELHLVEYQDNTAYIGKYITEFPGKAVECLDKGQSIIFNNQQLLHAVNPYLTTQITTRRTIYQERLNILSAFDTNLLLQFGPIPVPRPSISMLSGYLNNFIHPVILPKRVRQLEEMTREEQQYVATNETPNELIRMKLIEKHGDKFNALAQQLNQNGVLILPELLTEELLHSLQINFDKEISKKTLDKQLQQTSFNAVVDKVEHETKATVERLAEHAPLQALIQHYLGHENIALASWRGYRQEPRESMHYRAWDWHNDQKALGSYGELKIMILLTDLDKDGQAMRVMPGSHHNHWIMPSQKFTKYDFNEALSFSSSNTATLCYGKAGTVILFDTNMVHSGFRNLSKRRDVITINFVPALENSPIMFSDKAKVINSLLQDKIAEEVWSGLHQSAVKEEQNLSPQEMRNMRHDYYRVLKFEDAKSRFMFEYDQVEYFQFVDEAVQADLSADLDLPIRYGTHDVERDKQFVAFRDAGRQHIQFQRLHDKLNTKQIPVDYVIDITEVMNCIHKVINNEDIKKISEQNIFVKRTLRLLNDLLIAIHHNDTTQRLRTNLIYTYFSVELIHNILSESSSSSFGLFQQNKNTPTVALLANSANSILSMYVSAVYLDDMNESLQIKSSVTSKRI